MAVRCTLHIVSAHTYSSLSLLVTWTRNANIHAHLLPELFPLSLARDESASGRYVKELDYQELFVELTGCRSLMTTAVPMVGLSIASYSCECGSLYSILGNAQ